ncbi:hypothetical protein EJ06DRAFT_285211 [Trichodelitschia bisporula]|uniref:Uncharacterized protein n=1 Tax=Trichodelitschia bisporula TaxID=703511 RepID=A0A6G1I5Q9_9PEZI|nr:hypothetical protein EJ06DRAFT_285211 [Trichodelitschia bisporula]
MASTLVWGWAVNLSCARRDFLFSRDLILAALSFPRPVVPRQYDIISWRQHLARRLDLRSRGRPQPPTIAVYQAHWHSEHVMPNA